MHPKLRAVDVQWITHEGEPALFVHDSLALCEQGIIVPGTLAPLLGLMDGSRDIATLQTDFELRSGFRIPLEVLRQLVEQMDELLLFDSAKFADAHRQAIRDFRAAPYRKPALAGPSYPATPQELKALFDSYLVQSRHSQPLDSTPPTCVRGIIIPHIDYHRGGRVYAEVLEKAKQAIGEAEIIVVLGTDHKAIGPGITMTRQHYATPWGVIPTSRRIVDAVAEALGDEETFGNELHHRQEHSVELAAVWLHYFRQAGDFEFVPILCSSFQYFMETGSEPADDATIGPALEALHEKTRGKRTLFVAAADMAHVGPAFGDPAPFGHAERTDLAITDAGLLQTIRQANPQAFFRTVYQVEDRYRVCGLAPIYLTLQLVAPANGQIIAYDQCPADAAGGSFVSISGALLG